MRTGSFFLGVAAIAFGSILVQGCLGASNDCALFLDCQTGGSVATTTGGTGGNTGGIGGIGGTGGTGGTGGAPPACDDGDRNGGESDIDCGKVCPAKCSDGQACGTAEDCISNVCGQDKTCKPAGCGDGTQNGGESAIDCGGPTCDHCGPGETCNENTDCAGNECDTGICKANCQDGVQNNGESDIDCGSVTGCLGCDNGKTCVMGADCTSGQCPAPDGVCCDNVCGGECLACLEAKTGKANGTCAPIKGGEDPDSECPDLPSSPCATTGLCSAFASCALYACMPANAVGACDNGACLVGSCNPGYADCDGNDGNGCETNIATSTSNCGACGTLCTIPNGTAKCEAGQCAVASCNNDRGDCNNDPADGCETTLNDTEAHCGACGNACSLLHATPSCDMGVCKIFTCQTNWGNCDGNDANGCEYDVSADVANCGACGRACNGTHVASKSCSGGTCNSTCDPGWANCLQPGSGGIDDGCEQSAVDNDDNCGGCGNSCSQQGGNGNNDFECDGGAGGLQQYCTCSSDAECDGDGVGLAEGTCTGDSDKRCNCGGTNCRPGEACAWNLVGVKSVCSCNDGAACGATQTCCNTPAGCFDLLTDTQSCGACGHVCPPEFNCAAGTCRCDSDADCNAGTVMAFTCNGVTGICSCNGVPCAAGDRCQPDGTCG